VPFDDVGVVRSLLGGAGTEERQSKDGQPKNPPSPLEGEGRGEGSNPTHVPCDPSPQPSPSRGEGA
jgi:hypothetical protein